MTAQVTATTTANSTAGGAARATEITLRRPDDWHLHVRDGATLRAVIGFTAERFGRAIIMPNLKPPVTTTALALEYRKRILDALPAGSAFEPLMTLYLTDRTDPAEVDRFIERLPPYLNRVASGNTTCVELRVNDTLFILDMGLDHFLNRPQHPAKIVVAGQVNRAHSAAADLSHDLVSVIEDRPFCQRLQFTGSTTVGVDESYTGRCLRPWFAWSIGFLRRFRFDLCRRL